MTRPRLHAEFVPQTSRPTRFRLSGTFRPPPRSFRRSLIDRQAPGVGSRARQAARVEGRPAAGAQGFRKGHRVMVQVSSSWFPVIDRNPQTYVPNIFEAKAGDFVRATQRVYHTPEHPSHVTLDTVPAGTE